MHFQTSLDLQNRMADLNIKYFVPGPPRHKSINIDSVTDIHRAKITRLYSSGSTRAEIKQKLEEDDGFLVS